MNMDGWLNEAPTCPSNTWQWQNQTFRLADEDHKLRDSVERNGVELKFSDGKLTGTNRGEWGGTLTWHPRHGNPTKLHGDNVIAILPDGSNAVVIYGLDYVEPTGYALLFTRTDSGDWQPKILARLLSAPRDVTTLGPGLYAALNRNRAIVFSASQGILGLASCKP